MDWLVDTNILVYAVPLTTPSPHFAPSTHAIRTLHTQGETLWITPQNLIEFYVTLTRPIRLDASGNPRRNSGLGFTSADAILELDRVRAGYELLEDVPDVWPEWDSLIRSTGITDIRCYDVRLAAFMRVYGLTHLLTFNVADFTAIPGLTVVDPRTL